MSTRSADLGDDGRRGDRNRSLFQPYPVVGPGRTVIALGLYVADRPQDDRGSST